MKYMGSKRIMLANGLGNLIRERAQYANRIVDLCCCASNIAWYSAENTMCPVYAVDLQSYAVILAKAVVERDYDIDPSQLQINWLKIVKTERQGAHLWRKAVSLERNVDSVQDLVFRSRAFCEETSAGGSICNSYGGHYFSPAQACTLDCMLRLLPSSE